MAQIVINISDEEYEDFKTLTDYGYGTMFNSLVERIANGIVLPKGHGALKDADKLLETWYDDFCEFMTQTELDSMNNIIKNAPTIIEADMREVKE